MNRSSLAVASCIAHLHTMPVAPLHIGYINAHPVRFFRSPGRDPEIAWHSVFDLFEALGLRSDIRKRFIEEAIAKYPLHLATIMPAGDDIPLLIGSYPAALGLFDIIRLSADVDGHALQDIEAEYSTAASDATFRAAQDLPEAAWGEHARMCAENTNARPSVWPAQGMAH